jgi:hypothetical protein
MGLNKSTLLPEEEIKSICEETGRFVFMIDIKLIWDISGFTFKQVQRLYIRFQELEGRNPPLGFLTREDLLNIHKVALNPLGKRLVDVIIEDYGQINKLNFRQFANLLARFSRDKSTTNLNTKEKKLLFLFSVCDSKSYIHEKILYLDIRSKS